MVPVMALCGCDCGEETKPGNRFIHGHNKARAGVLVGEGRPFPPPNPSGLCLCGCGRETVKATRAFLVRRIEKGQHARYLPGHSPSTKGQFPKGHRPANVSGGLRYNPSLGRWQIRCRDGSFVYFYRAVVEAELRRALDSEEIVHHINSDPTDDRLENLRVFSSQAEHQRHHTELRRKTI